MFFFHCSRQQITLLLGSHPIKATTKPISLTVYSYNMFSPSLEDRCLPAPPLSRPGLEVQQCPEGQIIA